MNCEWFNFRGVPIFVVFVEGPIYEFKYPRNSEFLYELWRKILWQRILNPTNASFFQSTKIITSENKAIHNKTYNVLHD